MSTIPSLNLFNPTIVPEVTKMTKNNTISTGFVGNLRNNGRIKMTIMGKRHTKPCGRCGGAK